MNIQKANQLRRLVEHEISDPNNKFAFVLKAYWRGVRECLFVMLQLESAFDRSTPEDLISKLRSIAPGAPDVED